MTMFIKNGSNGSPLLFFMVQSSDHITALTGASPTVTISKNGGSFASPSGAVTEIANGWYKVAGNATDSNTSGPLALHATAASGDPSDTISAYVVAFDPTDAVRLGLSCLPNTAVTTNASLLTSGTGTDQLSVASGRIDAGKILGTAISTPATAGILDVNVKNMNNVAATSITAINANQGTTQPVNYTGTGASALVKSDMVDIAGSAVSTSAAQIGVNAVNIGGTAAASATIGTVTTVTTATNLTNAPTSGDFTTAMKTSLNAATPASIAGSVGSVTGNVGGNVVGSVGSVTGLTASNLDTTVSSRLASASYIAPDNSGVAAIKTKTDQLVFTVAGQVDANTKSMNDTTVNGTGISVDLWRGA